MRILLIQDCAEDWELVASQLQSYFADVQLLKACNEETLPQVLEQGPFDLALIGCRLGQTDGLQLLSQLQARFPTVPVIMVADPGDEQAAVTGMHAGLSDYLCQEDLQRLPVVIERSLERAALLRKYSQAEKERQQAHDELEARVQERTRELQQQNRALEELVREQEQRLAHRARSLLVQEKLLEKTRQQAAVLEATLAAMTDLVIIQDNSGRVMQMNAAAERVLGFATEERTCPVEERAFLTKARLLKEDRELRPEEMPFWRTQHGETVDGLLVTIQPRTEDHPIPYLVGAAPIRLPDGAIVGSVLAMRDVSLLHAIQKEMEEANQTLQWQNDTLELQSEVLRSGEQALRERENELRLTMDATPALISYIDPDCRYRWVNRSYEHWFGLKPQDLQGQTVWEALGQPVWEAVRPYIERALAGETVTYEQEMRFARGGTRWVRATYTPDKDEAGHVRGFVAHALDVTERRQVQIERERLLAEVERARQLGETLNRIHALLASSLDVDATMQGVLAEASRGLGLDAGSFAWREGEHWTMRYVHGLPQELVGRTFSDQEFGLSTWAVQHREVLVVDDLQSGPRPGADTARGLGLRSLLLIPLLLQEQVIGVLSFDSSTAPVHFNSAQVDFARKLGVALSLALENARLYEQARRDAETRANLLREVNHRVKNNLSAIIGLLYSQMDRPGESPDSAYQAAVSEVTHRIEGLSIVHGMLSASQWAPLRLAELVGKIARSTLEHVPTGRVALEVSSSPVCVSADQAHTLALVINELTLNVAKHALQPGVPVQISVAASLNDRTALLIFRDNGPGYPEGVLAGRQGGVGLGLLRNLVRQNLRGQLVLRNEGGAVAEVHFPAGET